MVNTLIYRDSGDRQTIGIASVLRRCRDRDGTGLTHRARRAPFSYEENGPEFGANSGLAAGTIRGRVTGQGTH